MFNKIRDYLAAEEPRLLLWAPLCMAAGAGLYLLPAYEPHAAIGPLLVLIGLLTSYVLRHNRALRPLGLMLLCLAAGYASAQWRTQRIDTPALEKPIGTARISGRIADISPTPKGAKLILDEAEVTLPFRLRPGEHFPLPRRISLSLRGKQENLIAGMRISLRAGLYPPPAPPYPGGFNFARHFYFKQIGAVGYGLPPVKIEMDSADIPSLRFTRFRHNLNDAIRAHFSEPAGAIAAAFVTGETRTIPEDVLEDMRAAGLYHLLAVSGMNLSIVAGLAFFCFRFLFAAVPSLSLRYDVKKWAALIALIVSYVYLQVAGSPVSAERAFVMVSLIFLAILCDREPTPMRSVALAAMLILLVEPEAVLSAGFQLSFAATAGLVTWYEERIAALYTKGRGWLITSISYCAAIFAASVIAWAATEPFIIFHFNQFSTYGVFANTLADPLVTFILMPLVAAGVVLMPLGLGALAFTPLEYAIGALLSFAHGIASLPHAFLLVPSPTPAGFMFAALGVFCLCILRTPLRWFGLALVAGGMLTALSYNPPDMLVSDNAKRIALRLEDGSMVMLRGKANSFGAEAWLQSGLQTEYADKKLAPAICSKNGCIVRLYGKTLAFPRTPDALHESCNNVNIVITDLPQPDFPCTARVISKYTLRDAGGFGLWLKQDITLRPFRETGNRPWLR